MSKQELTPEWLKDLERTSWQIELLVSGGLIFTLYSLPAYINSLLLDAYINTDFSASILIIFIAAFVVAKALLIGFGVNLLLRAIWLALLGVHFSYPDGVDYERLNYSSAFEQEMKRKPSTLTRILWFERWASLSYSIAISLTIGACGSILMVAGLYYFILERVLPELWLDSQWLGYLILVVVCLFSFGWIDRMFYRRLRNRTVATRRYFKFSQFLKTLNFTRLLQLESLTILSNNRRWLIHLINLSYFAVAIVISLNDMTLDNDLSLRFSLFDGRNHKLYPAHHFSLQNDEYDDLLKEGMLVQEASIPSEFIETSVLPVFITYDEIYDRSLDYAVDSLQLTERWEEIDNGEEFIHNTKGIQATLNEMFVVRMNGIERDSLRWYFREHPTTKQLGFSTYLDIATLERGQNELRLNYIPIYRSRQDTTVLRWIPFWKE
ncbi:MAG: hypothetical protein AAF433_14505 [Bacteroidota bacterium]